MRAQAAAGAGAAALRRTTAGPSPARRPRHRPRRADRRAAPRDPARSRRRPPSDAAHRPAADDPAVGRTRELATIDRAWADAGAGPGGLVLVDGVGGIGKTRLLDATRDLAESTGGLVLRGRCHPAERSLFLQPYVDALRPVLLELLGRRARGSPPRTQSAVGAAAPRAGRGRGGGVPAPATAAIEAPSRLRRGRRGAAPARRARRPLLLAVDDLQDGGAATVDLLGYLAGRLAAERVLLVGAVRAEDAGDASPGSPTGRRRAARRAAPAAVEALASAAGLAAHAAAVMGRTAGHPLSVVEYLRALAAGEAGVPESLAAAVLARVARLDAARPAARPGRFGARTAGWTRGCSPTSSRSPRSRPCGCARSWPWSGCSIATAPPTSSPTT